MTGVFYNNPDQGHDGGARTPLVTLGLDAYFGWFLALAASARVGQAGAELKATAAAPIKPSQSRPGDRARRPVSYHEVPSWSERSSSSWGSPAA